MTRNSKLQSHFATASIVFYSLGCSSSQIASDSQHPASPEAAQAPLPPVGEALSEPTESGTMATSSPGPHVHEGGGMPDMTHPAPPSAGPDASHTEHSGSAATPSTSDHASHGSHDSATQPDKAAERWTCPMHPEVIQPEPGKCPKCGMTLVPVTPKP
jgi:hypothetical protein